MTMADILSEINSPYDYDAYLEYCDKAKIKAAEIGVFFSISGTVYGAAKMFPEMSMPDAYSTFIGLSQPGSGNGCCGKKEKLPTLGTMAKSLASTSAQFVASGFKLAEDHDKRMETCSECEHLTSNNRCQKCGCFMKLKTRMAVAKCPIGKW